MVTIKVASALCVEILLMLCTSPVCASQASLALYLDENVAKCLVTSISKSEKIMYTKSGNLLRIHAERKRCICDHDIPCMQPVAPLAGSATMVCWRLRSPGWMA
jgi:hypothetical protein